MNKYFTKENLENMKNRDLNRIDKLAELMKHAAAVGAGELLMNEPEVFNLVYPWIKRGKKYAEGLYQETKENIEFGYEVYNSSIDRTEAMEEIMRQNQTLIEILQKAVSNNSSEHREMLKLVTKKEK